MSISTLFWRPVNLLRPREIRAKSPHTSVWGLVSIYQKSKRASILDVINNISRRIFTGHIGKREWDRLIYGEDPLWRTIQRELLLKAIVNCGIPETLRRSPEEIQFNYYQVLAGLMGIALNSDDASTLSMLCENTQKSVFSRREILPNGEIRRSTKETSVWLAAALNPNTHWEDIAKALSNMPKEYVVTSWKTVYFTNTDTYEATGPHQEANGGVLIYSTEAKRIAAEVFEIHGVNRELIMARLKKLNSELYRCLN